MNIWHILILASTTYGALQCRHGVLQRREWRNLDNTWRDYYVKAVKSTMYRANPKAPSFYDSIVKLHLDHAGHIHGYASFFPWHRYLLVMLEQEMQKNGYQMALPYWDWGFDAANPHLAPIWGTSAVQFGTGGNPQQRGCVTNGAFPNMMTFYSGSHCLSRGWQQGIKMNTLTSNTVIDTIIKRHSGGAFDAFRTEVEGVHNGVHNSIGGDMGDMQSPNDPVFYLHHVNIDRIWWQWQQEYPKLAKNYDGTFYDWDKGTIRAASANDPLTPFPVTAKDTFEVKDLCYTYVKETPVDKEVTRIPESSDDAVILTEFVNKTEGLKGYDLLNIETAVPVPDASLIKNNLPVEEIRAFEVKQAAVVEALNNNPEKVPETALWNRVDMLQKLIEEGEKNFYASIDNVSLRVRIRGTPSATDLKRKVMLVLRSAKIDTNRLQSK